MLESGYIKIHRSLLNWEWYSDINTKVVFLHLLLTVNYEDQKWQGITIKRGQRVSSYQKISTELKLSIQSVRTALAHLISTGEVTHETYPKYGVFTVINYDKYQTLTVNPTVNQQSTNSQLTVNQQSNQQSANNNGIKLRNKRKQESKKEEDDARAREDEYGNPLPDPAWQQVSDCYLRELGMIGGGTYAEKLESYVDDLGPDIVCLAIQKTNAKHPDHPPSYLTKLLEDWFSAGIRDITTAEAYSKERERKQANARRSYVVQSTELENPYYENF